MLSQILKNGIFEAAKIGHFETEVKISDNLKVSIRPLTNQQLTEARLSISKFAQDPLAYSAVEQANILSMAIFKVNGESVLEMAQKEISASGANIVAEQFAKQTMLDFLGGLPVFVINELSDAYNNVCKLQMDALKTGEVGKAIENF